MPPKVKEITILPLTTGVTGTLPVANGGTGVTSSTGSGNVVLSTSPTLVTPALGTPSALVGTNITGTAQAAVIAVLLALVYIAFTRTAHAAPEIYDSVTGQYLGNLSNNQYDPNSVSNKYGRYGSEYSPDSVNNKFGVYGSPYSNQSVRNQYATQPPVIINRGR